MGNSLAGNLKFHVYRKPTLAWCPPGILQDALNSELTLDISSSYTISYSIESNPTKSTHDIDLPLPIVQLPMRSRSTSHEIRIYCPYDLLRYWQQHHVGDWKTAHWLLCVLQCVVLAITNLEVYLTIAVSSN